MKEEMVQFEAYETWCFDNNLDVPSFVRASSFVAWKAAVAWEQNRHIVQDETAGDENKETPPSSWAICRDGYIRYDTITGLLEIYNTRQDAQRNKKQTDNIVPVRMLRQYPGIAVIDEYA
jgi:hypothetical protein